jgi:hypothetical protein
VDKSKPFYGPQKIEVSYDLRAIEAAELLRPRSEVLSNPEVDKMLANILGGPVG